MTTYILHATAGREFDIAKEIMRRINTASVLVIPEAHTYRIGRDKDRQWMLGERPALPNILWADMTPEQRGALATIRGLSSVFEILPDSARADVSRFRTEIEQRNEAVTRAYHSNTAPLPAYEPGQALAYDLIDQYGVISEIIGKFRKAVMRHGRPVCVVDVEMMGRTASVDVPAGEVEVR